MKFAQLVLAVCSVLQQPLLSDAAAAPKNSNSSDAKVTISDEHTNKSSPHLYGTIFEDINHSGDGGLYGELLVPLYQRPAANVSAFESVGGVTLQAEHKPITDAQPMALKATVQPADVPEVGFYNKGWFGIDVKRGRKYTLRFYAHTPHGFDGKFKASLRQIDSLKHYADAVAKPAGNGDGTVLWPRESNGYQLYTAELEAQDDCPDLNTGLFIVLDGDDNDAAKKYKHSVFYFQYVSLMAENFKGRENGLRKDLATVLDDMDWTMLRFPGGNDLEGKGSVGNRWKWNETIGALIDRPGHPGFWGYSVSDGLGLHEYFEWCEDMGYEPMLGVYDGLSIEGPPVPKDDLQPFIDDALNELEYVLGDSESTKWGKLRAQNGRKEPWALKYVEIGNEDFGGQGVAYRFPAFHRALSDAYPNITFVASTPLNTTLPDDGTWLDNHYYKWPNFWVDHFDTYDNWPRNNTPICIGEYANQRFNNESRYHEPFQQAAAAEAVYMIGLERNSDHVLYSAYAPLLQNNNDWQAKGPSMIGFNAEFDNITYTTSYYPQRLFSKHKGDEILQLKDPKFDPLYYVATRNKQKGQLYIKIANPTDQTTTASFSIDVKGFDKFDVEAHATSHKDPYAINMRYEKPMVVPFEPHVTVDGTDISFKVGPYFAGVVILKQVN